MDSRTRTTNRVGFFSISINIILTILKISVGFYGNSKALIADGIHSLSDIVSTVIVLLSMKFAQTKADQEHPYGHGKAEAIGTTVLGMILLVTSLALIKDNIINSFAGKIVVPENLALWIAVLSILTKEGLYRYTIITGKKINSKVLIADAHHHRSDAISSVAALIGILGSKLGYPILDPLAGFAVSIFIARIGIKIFREATHELLDGTPPAGRVEEIETQIIQIPGVRGINNIKIRTYGPSYYIELAIVVDNNLNIEEAHNVSVKVQKYIKRLNEDVKEVFIHLDPE